MAALPRHHPRAAGAVLSLLLGPSRAARRRPADSYASLAEILADNLPKPIGEELGLALGGAQPEPAPVEEPPQPEAPPPPEQKEPDLAAMFGLKGEG